MYALFRHRFSQVLGSALVAILLAILGLATTSADADAQSRYGRQYTVSHEDVQAGRSYTRSRSYRRSAGYRSRGSYRRSARTASRSYGRPARYASRGSYGSGYSGGGGGVRWVASASCLNPTLRSVVNAMAQYGGVTVSSTCRSHSHNRRVGGAPRSLHLTGNAVDFRVHGNVSAAYAALRSMPGVGGLKHYGGGLFHVDTGARRSF